MTTTEQEIVNLILQNRELCNLTLSLKDKIVEVGNNGMREYGQVLCKAFLEHYGLGSKLLTDADWVMVFVEVCYNIRYPDDVHSDPFDDIPDIKEVKHSEVYK